MSQGTNEIDNRNYVVTLASARLLESIHAARRDLEVARAMIELAIPEEQSSDVEEAGWTAAVIRYVRALKSDPKLTSRWQAIISTYSPAELSLHQHLLVIRDGMYAHNVGIGSDFTTTANVGTYPDGRRVLWGVGIQSARISSPGRDSADIFASLLLKLINSFSDLENDQWRLVRKELAGARDYDWVAGGEYDRNLHFDSSSPRYNRELNKRKQGQKRTSESP